MYNQQPQFDINNPYANNNPYNDNLKFLKQIFARPYTVGIIVSLGVILAVMVYNLINSIMNQTAVLSLYEQFSMYDYSSDLNNLINTVSVINIIIQLIPVVVYLLPFIGFMLIYIKSKNSDDSSSPKAGITMITAFSIISIIAISLLSLIILFCLIIFGFAAATVNSYSSSSYYSSTSNLNLVGTVVLILFIVFAILVCYLLWSINGLRFSLTAKRAIKGMPLEYNGTKAFGILSILNVIFAGVLILFIVINLFLVSSTSILSTLLISYIPYFISYAAQIALNIFLAMLAFSYKKAVNSANYSISFSGANRYTGNISNATAYYQSTYQDPNANTANPPSNFQNYQQPTYPQQPQQPQNFNQQPQNFNPPVAAAVVPPVIKKSDTINCTSCGAENDANVKFCISCGASLNQQFNTLNEEKVLNQGLVCPTCSSPISNNDLFCTKCGTRLK